MPSIDILICALAPACASLWSQESESGVKQNSKMGTFNGVMAAKGYELADFEEFRQRCGGSEELS